MPPIKASKRYAGLKRLFLVQAMIVPKTIGMIVAVKNGALNSASQTLSFFIYPSLIF
jgi:hypothetical protein